MSPCGFCLLEKRALATQRFLQRTIYRVTVGGRDTLSPLRALRYCVSVEPYRGTSPRCGGYKPPLVIDRRANVQQTGRQSPSQSRPWVLLIAVLHKLGAPSWSRTTLCGFSDRRNYRACSRGNGADAGSRTPSSTLRGCWVAVTLIGSLVHPPRFERGTVAHQATVILISPRVDGGIGES